MTSRLVPLILAVALFMENMDSTVIATSLADIAHDIGSEPIALKLALTSYLVALAIFIPISAWMADRWGARNVFRVAILIFIAGSVACAASNSLLTFVLSRFLQGFGGALMTPVARLVLVRVTPRNQLVDAMAWLSIPGLIGPIVGPPVGGFITTYFSWHWIFLINVPIGLIGIVLVTWLLPDWSRNAPRRMDFTGFVMTGIAFAGWVFGISVLTLPALPLSVGYITLALGTGTVTAPFHGQLCGAGGKPSTYSITPFREAAMGAAIRLTYTCDDGRTVRVTYPDTQTAVLDFDAQTHRLHTAISADGARYVGGHWQWWSKGMHDAWLAELKPGEKIASAAGVACRAP